MFYVTGISKGNVNEVETKGMIWPEEVNLRDSNTKVLNPQDRMNLFKESHWRAENAQDSNPRNYKLETLDRK